MTETDRLETLLASEGDVTLSKHDAQEVVQKLRVRGGGGETIDRLESQLAAGDEIVLPRDEAQQVLEELRASGRRWVFGTGAPREPRAMPERKPEPRPEPEPERQRRRFWRSR